MLFNSHVHSSSYSILYGTKRRSGRLCADTVTKLTHSLGVTFSGEPINPPVLLHRSALAFRVVASARRCCLRSQHQQPTATQVNAVVWKQSILTKYTIFLKVYDSPAPEEAARHIRNQRCNGCECSAPTRPEYRAITQLVFISCSVATLAAYRGSNCSLARAMDGRI